MKVAVRTAVAAAIAFGAAAALAAPEAVLDVYKQANCGCCIQWADHMEKSGFKVRMHEVDDVSAVRRQSGIPAALGSCHTAKVGGYAIEGHVPAADVKRLLKLGPKAIGLAVPGMPLGSPGMESATKQAYDVLLVKVGGATEVFARH
jgi:hypothetical protein